MTENKPRKILVREWLDSRIGQLQSISRTTGIPVTWLYPFREGKIQNPGVDYIDQLWDYMEKEKEFLKSVTRDS